MAESDKVWYLIRYYSDGRPPQTIRRYYESEQGECAAEVIRLNTSPTRTEGVTYGYERRG